MGSSATIALQGKGRQAKKCAAKLLGLVVLLTNGPLWLESAGVEPCSEPFGLVRELSHLWKFPSRKVPSDVTRWWILQRRYGWHRAQFPGVRHHRCHVNGPGSHDSPRITRRLLGRGVLA